VQPVCLLLVVLDRCVKINQLSSLFFCKSRHHSILFQGIKFLSRGSIRKFASQSLLLSSASCSGSTNYCCPHFFFSISKTYLFLKKIIVCHHTVLNKSPRLSLFFIMWSFFLKISSSLSATFLVICALTF
jgi:hypothetical protein